MRINEIFRSLQGESTYAGLPCTFIRLSGCNLACAWCDTSYARSEGTEMSQAEILRKVRQYPLDLIELTGGEPLLQSETPDLARQLLASGATVLVETNGTLNLDLLPSGCVRIMDVKTPSSGCYDLIDWSNVPRLAATDQVKFVVADYRDWLWSLEKMNIYSLLQRCTVLCSCVFGKLPESKLAEWILSSGLAVRMQLQAHKYIWAPDQRGV